MIMLVLNSLPDLQQRIAVIQLQNEHACLLSCMNICYLGLIAILHNDTPMTEYQSAC